MALPGFYHYTNLATEKDRPNLIYASDIPHKITACVSELHLYAGGDQKRVVDLASYIRTFLIALELNALLIRNWSLNPSDLISRNLVFVAKSRKKNPQLSNISILAKIPEVWVSILSMRHPNGTYVVNFQLLLEEFTVDLSDLAEINVSFVKDQNLDLFNASDPSIIEHLQNYIRHRLLCTLKNNSKISVHIKNSATILQTIPLQESHFPYEPLNILQHCFPLDLVDSCSEDEASCIFEKQLVFNPDYDTSDEDIRILQSDDSARCTGNEDDELELVSSHPNLKNILDLGIDEPPTRIPVAQYTPESPTLENRVLISPQIPVSPIATLSISPVKPMNIGMSLNISQSPTKSSSLAFIDHEENPDLEYAFRHKSTTVPRFIKDDKKFKFIKIGKVQKFVNMFEEQIDCTSAVGSKAGTRPTSPLNKATK